MLHFDGEICPIFRKIKRYQGHNELFGSMRRIYSQNRHRNFKVFYTSYLCLGHLGSISRKKLTVLHFKKKYGFFKVSQIDEFTT